MHRFTPAMNVAICGFLSIIFALEHDPEIMFLDVIDDTVLIGGDESHDSTGSADTAKTPTGLIEIPPSVTTSMAFGCPTCEPVSWGDAINTASFLVGNNHILPGGTPFLFGSNSMWLVASDYEKIGRFGIAGGQGLDLLRGAPWGILYNELSDLQVLAEEAYDLATCYYYAPEGGGG
ncbi:MAG: hypothetical protein GF350_06845 [Chitinivibrionales bacterium]|nr:hypothetical protein [Chitinivibrionales bacterium]